MFEEMLKSIKFSISEEQDNTFFPEDINMARRTRKRSSKSSESPMPATGAGLIRFYSEADSPGIKVGPLAVMILTVALIAVVLIAYLLRLGQ